VVLLGRTGGLDVRVSPVDDLLDEILAKMVERYRPRYVVLFGSFARGNWKESSDIDLFVILDDDDGKIKAIKYPGESKPGYPHVDLWCSGEDTFAASSQVPGSFCYPIAAEGKVLYRRESTFDLQAICKEAALEDIQRRKVQDMDTYLTLARNDLRGARLFFDLPDFNNAVYHAQQCAEKALKALLIQAGTAPMRTHNIKQLMEDFPSGLQGHFDMGALDNLVDPVGRDGGIVNVSYVADIPELTTGVVARVIEQASEILATCEELISSLAG